MKNSLQQEQRIYQIYWKIRMRLIKPKLLSKKAINSTLEISFLKTLKHFDCLKLWIQPVPSEEPEQK